VDSFNEGEEVPTFYKDGENAKAPWTRQWTFRRKDRKPFPIAVIYDVRNVGGQNRECFVQVTTDSNGMVSKITGDPPIGRMPAILDPADFDTWLGETDAPPAEAKGCLKVVEFDTDWECFPKDPNKKPPTRKRKDGSKPAGLF
jgi:putative SOS response-associated peptidase YedK